jgi:tetratricopeptide (TPR) repeat protein
LTSDARDRPARQQTLRNTIDWSYNLLDPAAQTLFARLAVFAGGCTLEAAEAVCGEEAGPQAAAEPPQRVRRAERLKVDGLLGALIDQSLVRHADGPEGEPRFWMLETLREYAMERLEASGQAERLRRQHVHYFLALAESAKLNARGHEQVLWLDRLAADHDNFRAALAWSLKADDGAELGLRLANGLGKFWQARSYYTEGQKWFMEVLRLPQAKASLHRVEALSKASVLAWLHYDYRQQEAFAQEAIGIARELGGPRYLCPALAEVVRAQITRGDFEAAQAAGQECLDLAHASDDARLEADALVTLGQMSRNQGAFAAAIGYSEQALALAAKGNDPLFEALMHGDLGQANWFLGQYDRAVHHFDRATQLYDEAGNKRNIGVMQWGLGCVALDQGHLATATGHFRRSLSAFRESDYRVGICGFLLGMAGIATTRGQAVAAVRLSGAADALRTALGHRLEGHIPQRYERQLARARAQLDEDTFAAAWAAGQALTPEQAILEALAQEVTEPELT